MNFAFLGLCLSVTLVAVLVSLLSYFRITTWLLPAILLVGGGCAIPGGLGLWVFGGLQGSLGDAPTEGAALQQIGLIIAGSGVAALLVGIVVGAMRLRPS